MFRYSVLALAFGLGLAAAPAFAEDAMTGVMVVEPWARATPKGADVGAGYLVIHNHGATADRLTGGSADFGAVEVHEMKMDGGMMKMRKLDDGLAIPAHGTAKLAPGGYHLMFTHLTRPLVKGEDLKVTLTFEHAGSIVVDFPVRGIGATEGDGKGGMKM